MNDPYKTLGISPDASDEEVKKAYRDMAKKYHPDNYVDNPLADLAQEKMKEINEAYDTITRTRKAGGSGRSGSYSGGTSGYSGGSGYRSSGYQSASNPAYTSIRTAINNGDLGLAEQLLDNCTDRDAEWNFLMGSLYYKKGWLDDARSFFQRAASMDPYNQEYRQAMNMVGVGGTPYRRTGYGPPEAAGVDMCDMCTAMMCMNMMCGGCR